VDSGAFTTCATPDTLATLQDGPHMLAVRAIDAAGNADASPDSRTFTVDTTAPETVLTGVSGTIATATPTFTFSASEDGATFACRVDDAAFAPCTAPYVSATLSQGPHMFEVRAADAAGNTDATPAASSFTVDTVPPQTTITSGPAAASTDSTPTFGFTSSETGSTFACSVDSGAFAPCTSPHTTAALGGGAHTFAVRATDPAGNTDPTPATSSFRYCSGPLGSLGVLLDALLPGSGLLCN
jgi:hypothetical protein